MGGFKHDHRARPAVLLAHAEAAFGGDGGQHLYDGYCRVQSPFRDAAHMACFRVRCSSFPIKDLVSTQQERSRCVHDDSNSVHRYDNG